MNDGVAHNGRVVVPYQCIDDTHGPCIGTFDDPCNASPAGRIIARTRATPTITEFARTEQIAAAAIAFVSATCHDDVYEYSICDQCGDDCGACRACPHSTSCPVGRAEYELRCAVTGEVPESEYYR